jgi:hypothetical protein
MGTVDRVLRAAVGIVLGYLIFSAQVGGILAVILGVFAVMLLGTAAVGYCPPYQLLGIRTCRCEEHEKDSPSSA